MATPVLERSEWGFRTAPGKTLHVHRAMPVGEVYVHQTAGRDPVEEFPSGDDDPADAFRALNEYAIEVKDYIAVDYSALVHTGPSLRTTIGKARWEYVPAATLDRNTESKAVCLLGWFGPPDPRYSWTATHARRPFHQELVAIAETIVRMMHEGLVRYDAVILGHRDNPEHPNATACPGQWLYDELPTIRRLVATMLAGGAVATPLPGGTVLHTYEPHKRIVDTRDGTGGRTGMIGPGDVVRVRVDDEGAKSAIVNVTVVGATAGGHVQVTGKTFGVGSTGNFLPGVAEANACLAAVIDGHVSVRIAGAKDNPPRAHLVVDLQGYVD